MTSALVRGTRGSVFVPEMIAVERGCEEAPMVRRCLARAPGVPIYLCMETPAVWEKVFAAPPPREQALGAALAAR